MGQGVSGNQGNTQNQGGSFNLNIQLPSFGSELKAKAAQAGADGLVRATEQFGQGLKLGADVVLKTKEMAANKERAAASAAAEAAKLDFDKYKMKQEIVEKNRKVQEEKQAVSDFAAGKQYFSNLTPQAQKLLSKTKDPEYLGNLAKVATYDKTFNADKFVAETNEARFNNDMDVIESTYLPDSAEYKDLTSKLINTYGESTPTFFKNREKVRTEEALKNNKIKAEIAETTNNIKNKNVTEFQKLQAESFGRDDKTEKLIQDGAKLSLENPQIFTDNYASLNPDSILIPGNLEAKYRNQRGVNISGNTKNYINVQKTDGTRFGSVSIKVAHLIGTGKTNSSEVVSAFLPKGEKIEKYIKAFNNPTDFIDRVASGESVPVYLIDTAYAGVVYAELLNSGELPKLSTYGNRLSYASIGVSTDNTPRTPEIPEPMPLSGPQIQLPKKPEWFDKTAIPVYTKHGFDESDIEILTKQIAAESAFDKNAKSGAGAAGLSQFMPATAKQYNVDVSNPASSLEGQAKYMKNNLKLFNGDWEKALAAYNYGEGAVLKKIKQYGNDWLAHCPKETRDYVQKIYGSVKRSNFDKSFGK